MSWAASSIRASTDPFKLGFMKSPHIGPVFILGLYWWHNFKKLCLFKKFSNNFILYLYFSLNFELYQNIPVTISYYCFLLLN